MIQWNIVQIVINYHLEVCEKIHCSILNDKVGLQAHQNKNNLYFTEKFDGQISQNFTHYFNFKKGKDSR